MVDAARSSAKFAAKGTWGLVPVEGTFGQLSGDLEIADGIPRGGLVLQAASLDTGNEKRDKHLRSADFFDVEHHAEVVFRLNKLNPRAGGGISAEGTLKVRHVTHPLTIDLTAEKLDAGNLRLAADTRVERADVGLTWNKMGMMRGDVGLSVDVLLVRV